VYFGDLEGALEQLDCSVSNDNGNNWKKNAALCRGPAIFAYRHRPPVARCRQRLQAQPPA